MIEPNSVPDTPVDTLAAFGIEVPWRVLGFSKRDRHVPEIDEGFRFDPEVTKSVLLGFSYDRRVYIHGPHGSGKTSHIEQVAAHLNWPCLRINLDGHVTRADLIGRDMVTVRNERQVTEFVPGLLVWSVQNPVALVLDEYDAGIPEVMFVIQRLLESQGRLTLLDQNEVILPNPGFRLFATANTAGQGDSSGLYIGTQAINQAQMDRWQCIVKLDYLAEDTEVRILKKRLPDIPIDLIRNMVKFANFCREAYYQADISTLLSLRTLITWGQNYLVLKNVAEAFRFAFFNRLDSDEQTLLKELFQRCFNAELINEKIDS